MSLTKGMTVDESQSVPGTDRFDALLSVRQEILEGVVDRVRGELWKV